MKVVRMFVALCTVVALVNSAVALEVIVKETASALIKPDAVPDSSRSGGCYVSNINPAIISNYQLGNPAKGYPTAGLLLYYFNLIAYTGRTVSCTAPGYLDTGLGYAAGSVA